MQDSPDMPLNLRVREDIHNRILRGEWDPGTAIPTEYELAAEYRVSRQTIREAIRALRYEGFLQSRRGSGTYVSVHHATGALVLSPDPNAIPADLTGLWTTQELRRQMRQIGEAEAMLQVPIGTPVQLIEELRLREGSPFSLMYTFRLVSDVRVLDRVTPGKLLITATVLHPYEARMLEDVAHTAALQLEILCHNSAGAEVELHRCLVPTANLQIDWPLTQVDAGQVATFFGLGD